MTLPNPLPSRCRPRASRRRLLLRPTVMPLLIAAMVLGFRVTTAQTEDASRVEVRVAKADGFDYRDLGRNRPIVMFPISTKVAGSAHASRLEDMWKDQAEPSRFIDPERVETLLRNRYLGSAFDSLVTSLSAVQPAESFSVLSTVAASFSARHAVVPVDVVVDDSSKRYAIDVMCVLVDLISGRPCLVMSASDGANVGRSGRAPFQAEVESGTFGAILAALREGP